MTCRICGNRAFPSRKLTEIADALTAERFSIVWCAQCGVGQTVPMPDDMRRYYASYHGNRHGVTARYRVGRRLKLLRQSLPAGAGRRVLDLGCGDGGFSAAAREAGWDVSGTEMEPTAAQGLGLDVRRGLEQFAEDETFDCVTLWHSLEHLPTPRETLSRVRSMLRPGGAVLIAVPDNGGWQSRFFGPHWWHLDVPRHLFHFDACSLAGLLRSEGFSIERQWHQELEYDVMGCSQSALNAIGLRPNVFFKLLTGKGAAVGPIARCVHLGLGAALSAAALPAVVAASCARRGGTLVVRARCGPCRLSGRCE